MIYETVYQNWYEPFWLVEISNTRIRLNYRFKWLIDNDSWMIEKNMEIHWIKFIGEHH